MKQVVLAGAILLGLGGAALADEPDKTTCYAGDENATVLGVTKTLHAVVERTSSPAKATIVETAWTPGKEKHVEMAIDVKANTLAWKAADGKSGTGTLVGKAWAWTAQALVYEKGDVKALMDSARDGTTITTKMTVTKGGKPLANESGKLVQFDCAKLADERAKLK